MTLDLPSSLDISIKEDRKWADSLLGKAVSAKKSSASKKQDIFKTDNNKKRKKHTEDNVVVVTDMRPIADRLHEKVEQAAAARKNKTESGEQPPPKKIKSEKQKTKKHQKDKRNGTTTTSHNKHKHVSKPIPEEVSDDELLEEESEVIHIDDYYNELTERVLNASYSSPRADYEDDVGDDEDEDNEEYDEDIRRKLLGIKKPDSAMSPELEEDLQYGTFDFSTGQPIPKYLTKGAKRTKRLDYLLKKAERRQKVLASNSERADQMRWSSALGKAGGVKEYDDPKKMKKLLKKISSNKQKSKEEWTKRIEETKAQQERKQARRRANINAKIASRKANKINRRFGVKSKKKSNKSTSPSTNKKRPGFEGRKQSFLNK